jgi:hypothetical protein
MNIFLSVKGTGTLREFTKTYKRRRLAAMANGAAARV